LLIVALNQYWKPLQHLTVTPFEYTGVVLGLVLVFQTNAGHERWWEARKLWGAIVNQSRNIAFEALSYGNTLNVGSQQPLLLTDIVKWTVAFSLKSAIHMPLFVVGKIADLLQQARLSGHIDGFDLMIIEDQRSLLIDHIGACERILKTPMPLVYAIKVRRFILIFLLLLPFSLMDNLHFSAVCIFFLMANSLLSLDRIGIELQNPFATKNLSHLPLGTICDSIKLHCLTLLKQSQQS